MQAYIYTNINLDLKPKENELHQIPVNPMVNLETKFEINKVLSQMFSQVQKHNKRKSECIKVSIVRRKYLRFYQKFNCNSKQGVLTPLLVSHCRQCPITDKKIDRNCFSFGWVLSLENQNFFLKQTQELKTNYCQLANKGSPYSSILGRQF